MANTKWKEVRKGARRKVLDTSEVILLGDAHDTVVSQWVVEVAVSGSGGSFIPKGRVIGSDLATGSLHDCVYYTDDSETGIAAGTPASAANLYYIPADGKEVFLDYTASSGTMTITVRPFRG